MLWQKCKLALHLRNALVGVGQVPGALDRNDARAKDRSKMQLLVTFLPDLWGPLQGFEMRFGVMLACQTVLLQQLEACIFV